MLLRFFIQLCLSMIAAWLIAWLLPWWLVPFAVGLVAYLYPQENGAWAGIAGGLGLCLLWAGHVYWINSQNDFLLLQKMSLLFAKLPLSLPLLTSFIGFLLGALGALSGHYARSIVPLSNVGMHRRR